MKQKYNKVATSSKSLVGIFQREGKILTAPGFKLLISQRKTATPTKPKYFIIDKLTDEYISSLFETEGLHTYNLDYNGAKYLLTLHPTQATITLRPQNNG
jgi:hypothetical protein